MTIKWNIALMLGIVAVCGATTLAAPRAHQQGRQKRPVISALEPNSYSYYTPNNSGHADPTFVTFSISGQNFGPHCLALWNGKGMATHFVSPTRIEATVPFRWIYEVGESGFGTGKKTTARIVVQNARRRNLQSRPAVFAVKAEVMGG